MEDTQKTVLKVRGMSCGGCAANVGSILKSRPGVEAAAVDLEAGLAVVSYRPGETDPDALAAALSGAGFSASVEKGGAEK